MDKDNDDFKSTHCKSINNILHCQQCFVEAVQDFNALEDMRRTCFMRWAKESFKHLIQPNCKKG